MKPSILLVLLPALFAPFAGLAQTASKPFPASDKPFPAPERPASTRFYWSFAKVLQTKDAVILKDAVGGNSIIVPEALKIEPGIGFTYSGKQTGAARANDKVSVTPKLLIGADIKPAGGGVEYQTFIYLYGYCELRYRLSRSEITFNVWQGGPKAAGSVTLPVVSSKWNRIQARIDGDTISLIVNGQKAEAKIGADWSSVAVSTPLGIGFGGEDRAFTGSFNHLYLAEAP